MQADQFPAYRNALEPLVALEVQQQLQHLPPRLVKYLNPDQATAYGLNRLPALYATSVEGWHRQQQLAKIQLAKQIFMAVRQGLAAVQRDPLKISTSLSIISLIDIEPGNVEILDLSQKRNVLVSTEKDPSPPRSSPPTGSR